MNFVRRNTDNSFHLSQKRQVSGILDTIVCTPYYDFSNTLFETQDKFEIRTITSFAFLYRYLKSARPCIQSQILNIPKYHNLILSNPW